VIAVRVLRAVVMVIVRHAQMVTVVLASLAIVVPALVVRAATVAHAHRAAASVTVDLVPVAQAVIADLARADPAEIAARVQVDLETGHAHLVQAPRASASTVPLLRRLNRSFRKTAARHLRAAEPADTHRAI
jgi:hypothetical protein